jgi:ribosome-binding protein aMBF1 (putative translation factor)
MRTHKEYLKTQLRDEEFAKDFRREKQKLRIAYDIHAARVKSGLSQRDLAKRAGVTQQMVSRVETASKAHMAHSTVCKIAEALGMDVGLVPRAR